MSGQGSGLGTASNPWRSPEIPLPDRGASGAKILESLTDILRDWPGEETATKDAKERHRRLILGIAGYADFEVETRPLDWPLHPRANKVLGTSLQLDDVPGMHRGTSLRSSILNRDMHMRIMMATGGHRQLVDAHEDCLCLLFTRLRQLDGVRLDDGKYRVEEENLLAVLHSYEQNRISMKPSTAAKKKELSWPSLSTRRGQSTLSEFSDVIDDQDARGEFLIPSGLQLVTYEYGYVQNWLDMVLPDPQVSQMRGTRQKLLRGASALLETRMSEVRAKMIDDLGPGCIVIDGGGRLTSITLPDLTSTRLSGLNDEWKSEIEEAEKYREQVRSNQREVLDLLERDKGPGFVSMSDSFKAEGKASLIASGIVLSDLRNPSFGFGQRNIDESQGRFLHPTASHAGVYGRLESILGSWEKAQKKDELLQRDSGREPLRIRFSRFIETLFRHRSDLSLIKSEEVSDANRMEWGRGLQRSFPASRKSVRQFSGERSNDDDGYRVLSEPNQSVLDYDVFVQEEGTVQGLGLRSYPCCVCTPEDWMDFSSIDNYMYDPNPDYPVCPLHRLMYFIGQRQRLIDSTLHPRDETVQATPRTQREVGSIVKLDANSLGIVFHERHGDDLTPQEKIDRVRRRSYRFNAWWWNTLSKSMEEVSGGDQMACWVAAGDDVMLAEYKSLTGEEKTENLVDKLMNRFSRELSALNLEVSDGSDSPYFASFTAGVSYRDPDEGHKLSEMLSEADSLLKSAKNRWKHCAADSYPHMVTLRDGSIKTPHKEANCEEFDGDQWHDRRSLVRHRHELNPHSEPRTSEPNFRQEEWNGLWTPGLIADIREHFSIEEEGEELWKILRRHYVLHHHGGGDFMDAGFCLVVMPPKR